MVMPLQRLILLKKIYQAMPIQNRESVKTTIASIVPEVDSTWEGKIFLTIDIDWASEKIVHYVADLVESAGVPATWFVTHDTPALSRLRANRLFELGIHPNFNWLMVGDTRLGKNASEVVARVMDIVPEARCVRSHSLTSSSRLAEVFSSFGLTHECNHFVPIRKEYPLAPWRSWIGMASVPHFWEDDLFCLYTQEGLDHLSVHNLSAAGGIRVFDFHPIHVFLNTESMSRYERSRADHSDADRLAEHRCRGIGTANWFGTVLANLGKYE